MAAGSTRKSFVRYTLYAYSKLGKLTFRGSGIAFAMERQFYTGELSAVVCRKAAATGRHITAKTAAEYAQLRATQIKALTRLPFCLKPKKHNHLEILLPQRLA
jgi:hypothetical protein